MITGGNQPAHRLAGVRELDAHYSSRRAPYDAAGNRISFTRLNGTASDLPDAVQAAYDAANEQIQFNSLTPNLIYDANGNLTSQTDATGTTTYTWDARNRLVAITGPGLSANFSYDALGRRVSKTINGITTDYQYDGNDIVAEVQGGAVTATYLRSVSIDEPFVRQSSSDEYYHVDALGSTMVLTDDTGAVQTTYAYELFGDTTVTGTSSNEFQYTGRENDGTGLYYYRARYYSPTLQRFINEDPVRFSGGDINLYAYVANSPINFFDPFGLERGPDFGPGDGSLDDILFVLDTADRIGDALILIDILNTPVSPTPDVGILGLAIKAGVKGIKTSTNIIFSGKKVTKEVAKRLGVDRRKLGKAIEKLKEQSGRRGDQNIKINRSGEVIDKESGLPLGNIYDEIN